jgi:transcriptional regulator with XRE-family HTH domain
MSHKKRPASGTSRVSVRPRSTAATSEEESAAQRNEGLARCIRDILATRNLTLYKVSARSRSDHAGEPAYHIPAMYFRQHSANWTPTLYQLSVLSKMSEYHFADWLAVFGFPPDAISRVQATLRRQHTILLDSTLHDPRTIVTWFRERQPKRAIPRVAALSEILERSGPQQLSSLVPSGSPQYVYAKIGMQDAFAFPELLPGSIVRANPQLVAPQGPNGRTANSIFLVEHQGGFCCCRLHYEKTDRITLLPTQLPFANVEFQLGSEARIIGAIDLEFRALVDPETTRTPRCSLPEIAPHLARLWTPAPLRVATSDGRFTVLLRSARLRAGLSFHDASQLSRTVASELGDERYFTSQASLSDYEARNTLPRHTHKLFTLCATYAIPIHELLDSFGLSLEEERTTAIPDRWMPQADRLAEMQRGQTAPQRDRPQGFLGSLLGRFGPPPFFLCDSLGTLFGLSEFSLHDVFWAGGQPTALHPSLAGALFVVVNRKRRTPPAFLRKSFWDQPLYLLARRNGSHVLASCTLEDHLIVVHPHAGSFVRPERLRNHADAEVVGQIVGVVRTLHPPT